MSVRGWSVGCPLRLLWLSLALSGCPWSVGRSVVGSSVLGSLWLLWSVVCLGWVVTVCLSSAMLPRLLLALSGSFGWLSVRLALSALVGCPESFVGSLAVVPWLVGRLVGLLCLSRLLPCLPRLLLVVVVLAVLA